MPKTLSDTARVILNAAANRDGHRLFPLPRLKAPPVAVQKTIRSLLADGFLEEVPAARDDEVWEQSEDQGRTTLIATATGLTAIGIEDVSPASRSRTKPAKGRTRGKTASRRAKAAKSTRRARTGGVDSKKESKQDIVIALLRRGNGASIEEMMKATDWQAHSVRGFMSGALKKRLGLELVSEKDPKTAERRYFVAALRSGANER